MAKIQARKDFLSFCVFTDYNFQICPHHEKIAEALTKLMKWEIQNLAICMPPRAWKSRLMQEVIAYMFGIMPGIDILYTGHSLNLLQWFSRNIRNRINSKEYQVLFNTKIASDSSAVNNWNIEKGGEFAIYGVGWGITGKGGHFLFLDDPYATRQDAESSTVRRTVSDWYWSTLLSRKQNDKAKQVIIMQRWREDDLIGEILEREWEKWEVLKIPALDENWESFWEEKFSKEYFEDLRKKSPLFFLSQYQQEPVTDGNGDFKKEYFKRVEQYTVAERLERMNIATFIDPAISEKQEADNTAIVTVGVDEMSNIRYVLEVKPMKASPDEIMHALFQTAKSWQYKGKSYKAGIEVVQYQKMLALAIRDKMVREDFYFFLEEIHPRWEKEARIRSILQPLYASGQIYHSDTINIHLLEEELLKFPKWKHDDMIDALASAVSMLSSQVNNQNNAVYVPQLDGINPWSF